MHEDNTSTKYDDPELSAMCRICIDIIPNIANMTIFKCQNQLGATTKKSV
ncbi:hypothetical protein JHK85_038923 [Glycine max]|uniref:Uncharacterized protein n=1 Tax=Glycine max TaxID=3847 RepID=K7M3P1_SOYBN|nr:hypothetical protein JHK85_038923 [Glycine max]